MLGSSEGSAASNGTWAYYFQDAIGSTRGLWDQYGDRIGKYDYTPFGGKYADHGEDITRKFTGHAWDSEARLYYTAYRYYSPDANRWLTRDPLGMVDGPNVYAYVVNNPVTMADPTGRFGIAGALLSSGSLSLALKSLFVMWGAAISVQYSCALGTGLASFLGFWDWENLSRSAGYQIASYAQHCITACLIQQRCGGSTGELAAWAVELLEFVDFDGRSFDWNDVYAGVDGALAGQCPETNCISRCRGWNQFGASRGFDDSI